MQLMLDRWEWEGLAVESMRSSARAVTARSAEEADGGEADMVALCREAEGLANHMLAAEGGAGADAWSEVAAIVEMVAARPARAPAGLIAKINLWRILAPDDVFAPDQQSLDEQLLVSIMADAARVRALNA